MLPTETVETLLPFHLSTCNSVKNIAFHCNAKVASTDLIRQTPFSHTEMEKKVSNTKLMQYKKKFKIHMNDGQHQKN